MMRREKEVIRAIYHKDVTNFFESIGLSEKLARGEIRCDFCAEAIASDNFRAVARKSGKLIFCCDKEPCVRKFSSCLKRDKA